MKGHKVEIAAWASNDSARGSLEVECECGWLLPYWVLPHRLRHDYVDFDALVAAIAEHRASVAS